jgi:hypothetical protein
MPYPTTFPSQDIMRVAAFMEGRGKDDKPLVLESAYTVLGFGLATLVPVHGQSGNGGPTPAPAPGPQPPQPGPPSPPPPPTSPGPHPPKPPQPKAEPPKEQPPQAGTPRGGDAAAEAAARQQSSSPGSQAGPQHPPTSSPDALKGYRCRIEEPPHGGDKAKVAADLRAWAHDEGEKLGRFGPMQAPSGRGEGFTHPEMRASRQPAVSPSLGAEPKAGGPMQSPHQSPTYAGPQYKFSPPAWLVPIAIQVIQEILQHMAA